MSIHIVSENNLAQESSSINPEKEKSMTTEKVLIAAAAICAAAVPSLSQADTYRFFVSGYPAANPRHAACSAATSLETGAYRIVSAADDLEARYRTCIASNATALRSDEFKAMIIIMR